MAKGFVDNLVNLSHRIGQVHKVGVNFVVVGGLVLGFGFAVKNKRGMLRIF